MARKRRLQSDSEDEQAGDQEIPEESPQVKKKRISSAKDADEDETMEEDDFNCSQAPDFTVTTVSKFAWVRWVSSKINDSVIIRVISLVGCICYNVCCCSFFFKSVARISGVINLHFILFDT